MSGESYTGDVDSIYSLLAAGTKLRLTFIDEKEAENFRVRFFRYKRVQDELAISIGMMEEKDKFVLSFSYNKESGEADLSFSSKPAQKQYLFKVIEEPPVQLELPK